MKKVIHTVNGVTFVADLKDFTDDEITIKCMLTNDNK